MTLDDEAFAVGTLNINGLPAPHPPLRRFADRAALLCRRLVELPIDVLNIQEVFGYRILDQLREHLGEAFPHVAFRRGRRFPSGGLVTFSRHPLGPASYRSFAGVLPRRGGLSFRLTQTLFSALHGMLRVPLADLPVTIVNTHLSANHDGDWSVDNRHYDVQRAQLLRLNRFLDHTRDQRRLRIVTGDFNVASNSAHYPLIVGHASRRDPFASTDPTTFHAAFLPAGARAHRIDFVLVEGDEAAHPILNAESFLTEPETVDGVPIYLSDHVGLSVVVGLARAGRDDEDGAVRDLGHG